MIATTLATAKMAESTPTQRPVAMTMAQTVALWALGIPPSPHMRSNWNLPSRIKKELNLLIKNKFSSFV